MTREKLDFASIDKTITNGSTATLEVDTSRASDVIILLDDGTTDNNPSEYTMTQRVHTSEQSDYQLYDEVTTETARSWIDSAWGTKMEFEFENTSGDDDNYRITIISYRDLD